MSTGRHGPQLADADLLETIADLTDAGETIAGNGGVLAECIAAELPFTAKTVAKHCSDLAAEGHLETAWGFHEGQQRKSYLPAAADEREIRADGGTTLSGTDQIPVAKCPNCGYVYGDDLEYRFPNPSVCACGEETETTTVADPETVRSLADDGLRADGGHIEHPTTECPECGSERTRPLDDQVWVCFDCDLEWRDDSNGGAA